MTEPKDILPFTWTVESERYYHNAKPEWVPMPGDHHPGARYKNPAIRVWEGPNVGDGPVIAEAMMDENVHGYIVKAWSRGIIASDQLESLIQVWIKENV